nr:hypothetical membrane protein [uncultured archaeon]CBH40069.1 hypothetical membrane protein [uncultured archaeon]
MELSRYSKDSLVGVISLIITASVLNLLLGVEWVPSVVLASVVGVAAGIIVDKLQGSLNAYARYERDLIDLALNIVVWGIIGYILLILILEGIGLLHSPSIDTMFTGWLIVLSAECLKIERDLGKMSAGLERFDRIESDIDEVKSDIGELKTGISKIESKFELIWSEFKKRKEL